MRIRARQMVARRGDVRATPCPGAGLRDSADAQSGGGGRRRSFSTFDGFRIELSRARRVGPCRCLRSCGMAIAITALFVLFVRLPSRAAPLFCADQYVRQQGEGLRRNQPMARRR